MPNHVMNVITMKGIGQLPLYQEEDGTKYFDFNKLIPMPESMYMDAGSVTDTSIMYYLTERCTMPLSQLPKENKNLLDKLVTNMFDTIEGWHDKIYERARDEAEEADDAQRDRLYENGKAYVDNFKKYGSLNWYDWSISNWGTKWNAYDCEIKDDAILFLTAWSNPEPIIKALAEKYPDIDFKHEWADENIGSNTGAHIYKNGKMEYIYDLPESNEAYDRAFSLWGENDCYAKDENGVWYHRDCDNCDGCG